MTTINDKEFRESKKIYFGKNKIKNEYISLKEFITKEFNVEVLNIAVDIVKRGNEKSNRVQVILKTDSDFKKYFFNPHPTDGVWNPNDTEANKRISEEIKLNYRNILKIPDEKFFIIGSSFENIARQEIYGQINNYLPNKLMNELNENKIWMIKLAFTCTYVMCYNTSQINEIENKYKKIIQNKIITELKKNNPYDFISLENPLIVFDSKENFDNNYQGNWFYYFR